MIQVRREEILFRTR